MSEALIIAILTAITSIATLIVALRSARKVEEVRHATNSLTDRLIASTKIASHAEGMADERSRARPD